MQIKRLVIENFKSIQKIELENPNPFTVFVGPNGSGKSTIFEALEFVDISRGYDSALSLFGGEQSIARVQNPEAEFNFQATIDNKVYVKSNRSHRSIFKSTERENDSQAVSQMSNFSRLFVGNRELVKLKVSDDQYLALDASNLEKVLKRVLSNQTLRNEIVEWLELFVPEFKAIEVQANPFDGKETLLWYEQHTEKPFTKDLISDGTYNILALLTAVYQSDDKPQFLCIEEPENGLHPQVAGELVDFFRIMCEERGHYIWLNTHSKSMAERVRPEEFVVVDKKNGATQVQQFRKEDFFGMRADEAWLTNSLNGGLAW
ncbi:MAG: chromosome segregation protein SMC [Cytophagales bacterium]|nr:MAG: chromosome segregation protein SMC [Cytophagales bacterium]